MINRRSIAPSLLSSLLAGCGAHTSAPLVQEAPVFLSDANPSTAPAPAPRRKVVDDAIARGVEFLKKSQNKDGSWGTGRETRGYEVLASVPGSLKAFQVATTALCVMALREVGEVEAHDRGVRFLVEHGDDARRDDGMLLYNTWAHTYALQALSIELQHKPGDPRLKKAAEQQLKRLGGYETFLGGWNYYDFAAQTQVPSLGPTSFGTAAGLVALWDAREAKIQVPQKMIDRCLKRLIDMRLPDHSYLYSYDLRYMPRLPANRNKGSVGRTQSANFALWTWNAGGMDAAKANDSLAFFFREHNYIEMGRKRQYPHESWYQTAPYYYYFGHYYTARLIEKIGDDARKAYGAKLADETILPHQEPDGSWWDFAMWDFHKPYGTAFAVMALLRCE